MLPQIANGSSSKLWVIPTEFTAALGSISSAFGGGPTPPGFDGDDFDDDDDDDDGGDDSGRKRRRKRESTAEHIEGLDIDLPETSLQDPAEALAQARGEVDDATAEASSAGERSGRPFSDAAEAG